MDVDSHASGCYLLYIDGHSSPFGRGFVLITYMVKFYTFFTTLCLLGFGAIQPAFASDPCTVQTPNEKKEYSSSIVLSEIYPTPTDGEEEFIELYNAGDEAADLEGWLIVDASGKTYAISTEDFVSTVVDAGDYFVVPHSVSKIYLNNGDDSVALYWPDETVQDNTTYTGAKSGLSWSLLSGEWEWTSVVTETKSNMASPEENTADTEETNDTDSENADSAIDQDNYESSNTILLSEMLPNPTGVDSTDEWIELVNTGSKSVYVGGWQLTDESRYFTIGDITIQPGEYVVFEVGETHINLNNSGDTIFLIDPFGSIINGTTYDAADEGYSWAMDNGSWAWTNSVTPGEENIFVSNESATVANEQLSTDQHSTAVEGEDVDSIAIDLFRSLDDGTVSTITGVVTVLPGVFGSQYFYIQDSNAGIQVYSYNKSFPEMQVGDWVRVTGEKSVARGETRIKVTTAEQIAVVDSGASILARDADTLDESLEGMLVQIEGEVVESSSSDALIDDIIKLVFKKSAGIDNSILEEGTVTTVMGIVAQYDDEYRLMPRSNEDIANPNGSGGGLIQAAEAAGTSGSNPSNLATENADEKKQWGQIAGVVILILLVVGVASGSRIRDYIKKKQTSTGTTKPVEEKDAHVSPPSTIFDALKKQLPIKKPHTNHTKV